MSLLLIAFGFSLGLVFSTIVYWIAQWCERRKKVTL
jgi:hypothetical protein